MHAWTESSQAARAAWLQPGVLVKVVHLSFGGDTDGADYCWQMTTDLVVHGWDLATALGLEAGIDEDLATAVIEYVEPRIDWWRDTSMFADAVPVPESADPLTRLVAMLGRDPSGKP
jgi:uncharacterized protein (TIGR03086 family)